MKDQTKELLETLLRYKFDSLDIEDYIIDRYVADDVIQAARDLNLTDLADEMQKDLEDS